MLRMTLVLLAGLYAVMAIWGEPTDDVSVARADGFGSSLAGMPAPARPASVEAAAAGLAALSDREAIARALTAGAAPEPDVVEAVAVPAAAPPAAPAAAVDPAEVRYVTGTRVNLRDGPTSNSAIVGSVVQGDRAEVLSDPAASWVRVRTDGGVEAWIFGRYLAETPA